MPVTTRDVKRTHHVRMVVEAHCDRCGARCDRPAIGGGQTVPCEIRTLKRPDDTGNWPEEGWDAVLCHACVDDLRAWLDAGAS